jgi:hypothetical protein
MGRLVPIDEEIQKKTEDDRLKTNFRLSSGVSPDDAVRFNGLAAETGLPVSTVENNPNDVQLLIDQKKLVELPPATKSHLSDIGNMKISKDDTTELAETERRVEFLKQAQPGAVVSSIAKGLGKAPYSMANFALDTYAWGMGTLQSAAEGIEDFTGLKAGGMFGQSEQMALGLSENIKQYVESEPALNLPDELRGRLVEHPEYLLSPEYVAGNVTDVAQSFIPMAVATIFAGPLIGAATGSAQEGSSFYADLRKQGVSEQDASTAAIAFGAIVGVLNKLGLERLLKKVPVGNLLSRSVHRAATGVFEAGTEYAEEPFQALIGEIAKGSDAPAIWDAVIDSFKNVEVIPGSLLLGGGMNTTISEAYQSRQDADSFFKNMAAVNEAVNATKTKERSPEKIQEFLEAAGMSEDIFITPEGAQVLYQNGPETFERLGVKAEEVEQAIENGQTIKVKSSAVNAFLSPEEFQSIQEDIKPSPGAFTQREVANRDDIEELTRVADVYAETTLDEVSFQDELSRIKNQVVESTTGLEGFQNIDTEEYAANYVKQVSAFANRMALQGQDRVELLQKFDIGRRSLEGGMQQQDQTRTPEFKEWFGESKVVDESGEPLVVYHGTADDIEAFSNTEGGRTTRSESAKKGFFFASVKSAAESYADFARPSEIDRLRQEYERLEKIAQNKRTPEAWDKYQQAYIKYEEAELNFVDETRGKKSKVIDAYLKLENPFVYDYQGAKFRDQTYADLIDKAKENGYDGVIFKNTYDGTGDIDSPTNPLMDVFVAFEPNQIKHIDNTRPTSDPRIMYQGQTRTPEFKEWFGESKVVDMEDNPLIVHHGTNAADIEAFNKRLLGQNTFENASSPTMAATSLLGFWFNENEMNTGKTPYSKDIPVYLSIQNPYEVSSLYDLADEIEGRDDVIDPETGELDYMNPLGGFLEELIDQGHDGIIIWDDEEMGGTSYIAFEPNQIKHVDNTRPTSDPRIMYQNDVELVKKDFKRQPMAPDELIDGKATVREVAQMVLDGDKKALKHIKKAVKIHGQTAMQDTLPNLVMQMAKDNREAFDNYKKLKPKIDKLIKGKSVIQKLKERVFKQEEPSEDAFKTWSEGATYIEDSQGREFIPDEPIVVKAFHGTTHEYRVVDPSIANIENYFGRGFYSSSSEYDVQQNYEGAGPDLTNRIELRKEQIAQELYDDPELFYDTLDENTIAALENDEADIEAVAEDLARKELVGDHGEGGKAMEVYVKMTNPLVLSPAGGTMFSKEIDMDYYKEMAEDEIEKEDYETEEEYQEALYDKAMEIYDDDYDPKVEGNVQQLRVAIAEASVEFEGLDDLQIWSELMEASPLEFEGEVSAQRVIDDLKNVESVMHATDYETGALASHEFVRTVIEKMGYDGIVMDAEYANKAWNMDVPTGTWHFINWTPNNIKSTSNEGSFSLTNDDMYLQAVYHGTPHIWPPEPGFPHGRPRLDKIGTGEGAAAYGWGWYSAESEGVGKSYLDAGARGLTTMEGKPIDEWLSEQPGNVMEMASRLGTDITTAGKELKKIAPYIQAVDYLASYGANAEYMLKRRNPEALKALEEIRKDGRLKEPEPSLYKIDIPDAVIPKLLDWDKPLSEQSEYVKSVLKKDKLTANLIDHKIKVREGLLRKLPNKKFKTPPGDVSGKQIYEYIRNNFRSDKKASKYLASIGVPGNKYLDGMSRGNGEGSYNYVIWDQKVLDDVALLERNGEKLDAIREMMQQQQVRKTRGSVTVTDEKYLISLFDGANTSTILHETGHIFLEEMRAIVESDSATPQFLKDYKAVVKWQSILDDNKTLEDHYNTYKPSGYENVAFKDLTDFQKEDVREVLKAEYFARGFEAYLMEGKAPSMEVRGAFARFRRWLTEVYRAAANLNVKLNDSVRGVFDRLVSANEDIESTAQSFGMTIKTQNELDALGVLPEDQAYMKRLVQVAKQKAEDAMVADRNRSLRKNMKRWKAEAKRETDLDPGQKFSDDLSKWDGVDRQQLIDVYGTVVLDQLPKRVPPVFRKGGMALEEAAALVGDFNSVDDMIIALKNTPTKKEMMANLIAQKQAAHDAKYKAEDYLLDTTEYMDYLTILNRYYSGPIAEEAEGKTAKSQKTITRQAFKSFAKKNLGAMSVRDAIRHDRFLAAMKKAQMNERKAILAGDMGAAQKANEQVRLNYEMANQAIKNRKAVEKLLRKSANINQQSRKKKPTIRQDSLDQLMDVLARFGLIKKTVKEVRAKVPEEDKRTLREWAWEMTDAGYPVSISGIAANHDYVKDYRDLSFSELKEVEKAITSILTIDKNERYYMKGQEAFRIEDVVAELSAQLDNLFETKKTDRLDPSEIKEFFSGIHSIHTKMEFLMRKLDGGELTGKFWSYFFEDISDAENNRNDRMKIEKETIQKIFSVYDAGDLQGFFHKRTYVDAVGLHMTKNQMLSVAMNIGNADNMKKLMEGYEWSVQQVDAIISKLSIEDMDFVQSFWDYIETFRQESFALAKEVTGKRPTKIEAKSFTFKGKEYKGGYYPLSYDSKLSLMAQINEQANDVKSMFNKAKGSASTKHSFNYERKESAGGQKVRLDLGVGVDHVFEMVHDLTHRKAVLNVSKLVRNKDLQKVLAEKIGMNMQRQLGDWLEDVAKENIGGPTTAFHRILNWARTGTTIMNMGFKATTMITQVVGITQTINELGLKHTIKGVNAVYGTGSDHAKIGERFKFAMNKSGLLRNRLLNHDRDIRDATKKLGKGAQLKDNVTKFAFYGIGLTQLTVDVATWYGAYDRALSKYEPTMGFEKAEARAVQEADSVVRQSQGGGGTKDLAKIQRGDEAMRLFTMFYSYFNTLYNLGAKEIDSVKKITDVPKLAAGALWLWVLPALLSELIAGRGPDDDETWGEWTFENLAMYPFQAIVGVRDLATYLFGDYGYKITPAESAFREVVDIVPQTIKAYEEGDPSIAIEQGAESIGYLLRLPLKQFIITLGNLYDYASGQEDLEPRDLVFTRKR